MKRLKKNLYRRSVASFFHTVSSNSPTAWRPVKPRKYPVIYKTYTASHSIKLSKTSISSIPLERCLFERKSTRKFSGNALKIDNISSVLRLSSGIKNDSHGFLRRQYPSAGALYTLEIYVIGIHSNLELLNKAVTHYNVKKHSLEIIKETSIPTIITCFLPVNHTIVEGSGCMIIITACFDRIFQKYTERGYRYALIESGHLAQNIYLICAALNIGCCSIGGYYDEKINDLLEIGDNEKTLYIAALGQNENTI